MSNLEQKVRELRKLKIDREQAKMIAEIQKMDLPKPTYGIATSQEIFQMGLKYNCLQIYQTQPVFK